MVAGSGKGEERNRAACIRSETVLTRPWKTFAMASVGWTGPIQTPATTFVGVIGSEGKSESSRPSSSCSCVSIALRRPLQLLSSPFQTASQHSSTTTPTPHHPPTEQYLIKSPRHTETRRTDSTHPTTIPLSTPTSRINPNTSSAIPLTLVPSPFPGVSLLPAPKLSKSTQLYSVKYGKIG